MAEATRLAKMINEIYFNKLHAKREAETARKGKKKAADQSDEPSGAQAEKQHVRGNETNMNGSRISYCITICVVINSGQVISP